MNRPAPDRYRADKGDYRVAVHQDLIVKYHQQDTDYYCGAACAQMVLAEIGAGILDQAGLYSDNHSHSTTESGWYTAPDGLTWTLNDRRPAGFTNSFVLFALANEDLISRKICWTIQHYNVAPVAMVYGWAHWIVVRGYEASDVPAGSADNSYSITAFDVNNPWPPTPTPAPPPPHTGTDVCGTGGDRGVADEHISYATWQADYMTGIPGGHWAGQFVAVCDPEPPGETPGPSRPQRRKAGDRLLTRSAAARAASAGLKAYGLYDRDRWRQALSSTEPGDPVLVQRLDHPRPLLLHRPDASKPAAHPGARQRRRSIRDVSAGTGTFGAPLAACSEHGQARLDRPRRR
jgi:hypothetical protein